MMTITWNDNELDVQGRIIKYYPATRNAHAEGGDVEIEFIWAALKTFNGEYVKVDIMPVLSERDFEEIEEIILESRNDE